MYGDEAAPLLFLPGLLCDSRIFAAQLERFPGSVAIDGFDTTDSIVAMAHVALAYGPERMSLLGHSMGGRVALEMVRLAPERIERLALASTGIHLQKPGEKAKRQALLNLGRTWGSETLVEQWLPPMLAPHRIADAALMESLHTMCVDAGVDAFAAQIAALLGRPEVASLLPSISCPTLVVVGSEDRWSPPEQHAEIAAAIDGAEFVVIPGSGHMLPAEAPEALNAAIAAWLSVPARSLNPTLTGE